MPGVEQNSGTCALPCPGITNIPTGHCGGVRGQAAVGCSPRQGTVQVQTETKPILHKNAALEYYDRWKMAEDERRGGYQSIQPNIWSHAVEPVVHALCGDETSTRATNEGTHFVVVHYLPRRALAPAYT